MPCHPDRVRRAYDEPGDDVARRISAWRPLHENAAEHLQRQATRHLHVFDRYNPTVCAHFCDCGARLDHPWNVIEGDHA